MLRCISIRVYHVVIGIARLGAGGLNPLTPPIPNKFAGLTFFFTRIGIVHENALEYTVYGRQNSKIFRGRDLTPSPNHTPFNIPNLKNNTTPQRKTWLRLC